MDLARRCVVVAAIGLVAAVSLAGCGSAEIDGTASMPSARTPSTTATSGASSPASRSAATSAPAPSRPSAKDGTNYRACFGGTCQVAVSRPVTIRLFDTPIDGGPLTVRRVRAGGVLVRMALPAGPGIDATIRKGCTTAFYGNNASGLAVSSCTREPGDIPGMYVKQLVRVESISGGTAILTLTSG